MANKVTYMVLLLLLFGILIAEQDDDCDDQVTGLVGNCFSAVMVGGNVKSSSKCCKYVREAQPDCVCPKITGEVTKVLKLSTALKIAKKCNRELPHNYTCGSYTLP